MLVGSGALAGRPNNSSSGNRTSASSSSSKSAHEAQTPEVQAQIVSRLTDIANRYLPAVHHAIQLVSMQPESHVYVRKYTKLKDILENPEANLHSAVQPSDVRRHPGVDQSRHHLSQQPPSQLLSRFRVPTTNLNTLLSQPLGGSSPTSTPDTQQTIGRSPHGKPILHHTSSMPHTSLLSTSPDVSLPNTASVPSSAGVMGSSSFPLDSQSTTRQGQFSYTSLEGQHNRSAGAAASYTSPCATPGRTFGSASANSNLQIFATEFKKISDKATHDKEYARQLYRAINELLLCLLFTFYDVKISQELKPFRETAGLLLPQDLYAAEMHSIQHKGPGEGPCLSKFAGSRDPIESSVIPTAEDITDLMETSTCEVKTQHQTNETVSQLDGGEIHFKPCTNMIKVDDVEMVSEKDQNGLQSDMIAEPAPVSSHFEKYACLNCLFVTFCLTCSIRSRGFLFAI
ncbi:unnamed protein product [Dicrocoelium dendriticum]|nr:unnamed protein product [Dicrocoelium dendriticum]